MAASSFLNDPLPSGHENWFSMFNPIYFSVVWIKMSNFQILRWTGKNGHKLKPGRCPHPYSAVILKRLLCNCAIKYSQARCSTEVCGYKTARKTKSVCCSFNKLTEPLLVFLRSQKIIVNGVKHIGISLCALCAAIIFVCFPVNVGCVCCFFHIRFPSIMIKCLDRNNLFVSRNILLFVSAPATCDYSAKAERHC